MRNPQRSRSQLICLLSVLIHISPFILSGSQAFCYIFCFLFTGILKLLYNSAFIQRFSRCLLYVQPLLYNCLLYILSSSPGILKLSVLLSSTKYINSFSCLSISHTDHKHNQNFFLFTILFSQFHTDEIMKIP